MYDGVMKYPTHFALWVFSEHSEDGHLCSHSFAGACGSPKQDIAICVVHSVKDLRLDGVEVSELVQCLQTGVPESRHW